MTEREAVDAIRRYAGAHGCTAAEYNDYMKAEGDSSNTFVIQWKDKRVDYFKAGGFLAPPDEIKWLKYITYLRCDNFHGELSWLGKPAGCVNLRLTVSQKPLPKIWSCAPTLTSIDLIYTEDEAIRRIPEELRELSALHRITIRTYGTYAIELPDWDWMRDFPHLETIDLQGCKLKSIPYSLVQAGLSFVTRESDSDAKGILLHNVKLDEGSLSLFNSPQTVIEEYYRYSQSETKKLIRECKVIFLGDGEAGKSSLIERILYDTFDPCKRATDGIHISPWNPYKDGPKQDIRLRIMDFGGQAIMHSMHRCFLTSHTVYVVVCASRRDGSLEREAVRWLETVRTFAPDCPVILTLSKADVFGKAAVNEAYMKERNPNLTAVLRTSAAEPEIGHGVQTLVNTILDIVPGCMQAMTHNADLMGLKQDLENMKDNYITSEQYQALCERHHYEDPGKQWELLDWFRSLGVAYFYKDTQGNLHANQALNSLQVLNPKWLTNGIYRLILRTPEQGPDSGFLDHKLIENTLMASDPRDAAPETTYKPKETGYILYVMRKFEISHYMGGGREMIPMLMNVTPPEKQKSFPTENALHLRWTATYLPNNLVHRLMIRKYNDLDQSCVWRTGGWFHRDEFDALASMSETALDLYVSAEHDRRVYMEELRSEVRRILSDLNIRADEVICCRIDGEEGEIPYEDVIQQYHDGMPKIYIHGIHKYIEPWTLLEGTYLNPRKEVEEHMKNESQFHIQNFHGNIIQGDRVDAHGFTANSAAPTGAPDFSDPKVAEAVAKAIQETPSVDTEIIKKLKKALETTAENEKVPFPVRHKLQTVLKSVEGEPEESVWEKIRPFLGDAVNLTKILTFLTGAASGLGTFFAGLAGM